MVSNNRLRVTLMIRHPREGESEVSVVVPVRSERTLGVVRYLFTEISHWNNGSLPLNRLTELLPNAIHNVLMGKAQGVNRAHWGLAQQALWDNAQDAANVLRSLASAVESQNEQDSAFRASFPRVWELLKFVMGATMRQRVFEPAYNDLLADHLETRAARFQTPWARHWIWVCFVLRTAGLVIQCTAVGVRSAAATILLGAIPLALRERIREWWAGFFS